MRFLFVLLLASILNLAHAEEFCGRVSLLRGNDSYLVVTIVDSIEGKSKSILVNESPQILLVQTATMMRRDLCVEAIGPHDDYTLRMKNLDK